jgi:hypothetical protein
MADYASGSIRPTGYGPAQDVQKLLDIVQSRSPAIANRLAAAHGIEYVDGQFVLFAIRFVIPVVRFGHWILLFVPGADPSRRTAAAEYAWHRYRLGRNGQMLRGAERGVLSTCIHSANQRKAD